MIIVTRFSPHNLPILSAKRPELVISFTFPGKCPWCSGSLASRPWHCMQGPCTPASWPGSLLQRWGRWALSQDGAAPQFHCCGGRNAKALTHWQCSAQQLSHSGGGGGSFVFSTIHARVAQASQGATAGSWGPPLCQARECVGLPPLPRMTNVCYSHIRPVVLETQENLARGPSDDSELMWVCKPARPLAVEPPNPTPKCLGYRWPHVRRMEIFFYFENVWQTLRTRY